jgi:cell division protein FtsB
MTDAQSNSEKAVERARNQAESKPENKRLIWTGLIIVLLGFVIWQQIRYFNMRKEIEAYDQVQAELSKSAAQMEQYQYVIDSLKVVNRRLKQDNDLLAENSDRHDGIFFEVQLGAFKDFNLDAYQKELAALRQVKHDGKNKLILGKFRSHRKALAFENDMKRLGLDEAFIVGRVDGEITTHAQALREYRKRNE